jgi:hypothetical protein
MCWRVHLRNWLRNELPSLRRDPSRVHDLQAHSPSEHETEVTAKRYNRVFVYRIMKSRLFGICNTNLERVISKRVCWATLLACESQPRSRKVLISRRIHMECERWGHRKSLPHQRQVHLYLSQMYGMERPLRGNIIEECARFVSGLTCPLFSFT